MGGTEIYSLLGDVLNSKRTKNLPRSLFLLTDGGVSNTDSVVNLIRINNSHTRVFCLGIGNGCSQELIVQGANAGKGQYQFVMDGSDDINDKVVEMLEAAALPVIDDFQIKFYNDKDEEIASHSNQVQYVVPAPQSVSYISWNRAITFYVFMKGNNQVKSARLSCFDSLRGKQSVYEISINSAGESSSFDLGKLAAYKMIKVIEEKQ